MGMEVCVLREVEAGRWGEDEIRFPQGQEKHPGWEKHPRLGEASRAGRSIPDWEKHLGQEKHPGLGEASSCLTRPLSGSSPLSGASGASACSCLGISGAKTQFLYNSTFITLKIELGLMTQVNGKVLAKIWKHSPLKTTVPTSRLSS